MNKHSRTSENGRKRSKPMRRSGARRMSKKSARSRKNSHFMPAMFDSLPSISHINASRITSEARHLYNRAKNYASEHPRETIGIAIAVAAVTWVALATKPGRLVFEASAAFLTPQMSRWFSKANKQEQEMEH